MTKSSILAPSHLARLPLFCLLFLLALSACDNSARHAKTNFTQPAVLPDSTALRAYHIALGQLATADQADRQAIFRVFRRYGFRSLQADTANRWLLRQDSLRFATFQALERRYGWPRDKVAGAGSVQQAYLLVQHAPDRIQATYQDTLRAAHARGELRSADYATYLDRVWVNRGKPQRYGTQRSRRVSATGQEEDYLFPVEDLPHLDQRRATMQLEPLLPELRPGTTILKPTTD